MRAAEKNEFAVVGSGPMRGHFPDDHRLSGSMSTQALMSADLVVFVGQYCMPTPAEWTLPLGSRRFAFTRRDSTWAGTGPSTLGL